MGFVRVSLPVQTLGAEEGKMNLIKRVAKAVGETESKINKRPSPGLWGSREAAKYSVRRRAFINSASKNKKKNSCTRNSRQSESRQRNYGVGHER